MFIRLGFFWCYIRTLNLYILGRFAEIRRTLVIEPDYNIILVGESA
jgi:hypothetical protein